VRPIPITHRQGAAEEKAEREIFFKITGFENAFTQLQRSTIPIEESEKVPIRESLGRVLSKDIQSPIDVPNFERSSRDGFALRSTDTFGASEEKPILLKLIGEVTIGTKADFVISRGECTKIPTGAMIPAGADSVVMIEYTEEEENQVKVRRSTSPGENIIKVGTDVRAGNVIFKRGRKLSVFDAGALGSLGFHEVDTYRRPRVSIMSTGNELQTAGKRLKPGMVYDINSITIHQAVIESGGKPIDLGIFPDVPSRVTKAIDSALGSSDVVLVSGGTSKGPSDLMLAAIQGLGTPDFLIHGIAMKPGKPTILASVKGRLVITLPGYPTSALIVYYTLVDPSIRKMAHEAPHAFQTVKAQTSTRFYSEIGRKEFKPCRITVNSDGRAYTESIPTGSEAITTLVRADGFVIISEDTEFIDEGEEVEVNIFPHRSREIGLLTGEQV
jgi:molybdenum cofactor synthesis domain-containing protein